MSEICAVIGILYLIGLKRSAHTNVVDLWDKDGTGIPLLRAVMSYRRFQFLLRFLRFDDKSTRSERRQTDKLAAIRTIYDRFVENCMRNYIPGAFMTIDEMLHLFRGRCSFIQYMPSKPAKYGLKIQALVDAESFYTFNLELYCGQQPEGPYKVSNTPSEIVKRLVGPIRKSNRNITMDNWYNSINLAEDLLADGLTCLGTMKKNKREIPVEFLPEKTREVKSSLFGFQKHKMLVSYVPKKNKAVILVSTMHGQQSLDELGKPEIILDYNNTKGGVDTVDKLCATYSVSRITQLWTQAFFYISLNITGINAQILYFASEGADIHPRRIFLKNLSLQLMKEHLITRSKIPSLPKDVRIILKTHLELDNEPEQPPLEGRKRGRCNQCRNSSTTLKCSQCNSFLCKKHSRTSISCGNCEDYSDD